MNGESNTNGRRTVLVAGATGLVGRALALRLQRGGWRVLAWARSCERARACLGSEPGLVPIEEGDAALVAALAEADAVVNLAGENLFSGRWTARRKRALVTSRVDLTQRLVRAMAAAPRAPRTLISGSAIGFYGDRGDEELTEASAAGGDFLARLCVDWEAAARAAEALGTRVVTLRTGIVLAAEGGALGRMLPLFRMGGGGRLGHGRQWMSWIALDDLIELIAFALDREDVRGPLDAVSPEPVSNRTFTSTLAHALRRPALLPAPGFLLRLALGESAGVLLASQRVLPRAAMDAGFRFRRPNLGDALSGELASKDAVSIGRAADVPAFDYARQHRPRYLLQTDAHIDAPLERVFEFFSRPHNLGAITPPTMSFHLEEPAADVRAGARLDYGIRIGPLPLSWTSRIDVWEPQKRFVDVQLAGPYRSWVHEHTFEPRGGTTWMRDRVWYAPPLGPLGGVANALFVAPTLRAIFSFRARAIRRRFGLVGRA